LDIFMEFGHKYYTQYGYVAGFEKEEKWIYCFKNKKKTWFYQSVVIPVEKY
jgi:hypothetical protein